jgi:hypothetical protein
VPKPTLKNTDKVGGEVMSMINEECMLKALALCREVRQRYWQCVDECLANSDLGLSCYDICEEEVAKRHGLSMKVMKKCIRE